MRYKEPKNKSYTMSPFWIKAIATALGRQHKVTIRKGDSWAMDMENKVLTYTDDICFLDENNILALLLHEIGHIRFSEWFDETTKIYKDAPEAAQNCVNAMEDVRIDDIMSRQYEASYQLIDTLNQQSVNEGLSKIIEHKAKTKELTERLETFKDKLGEANRELANGNVSSEEVRRFIEDNEPKMTGRMNPVAECMYLMLAIHYGYEKHPTIKEYKKEKSVVLEKAYLCADELAKSDVEYMDSTKEVQGFYEDKIYPIIKDLIERNKDGSEKKFKKQSSKSTASNADKMSEAMTQAMQDKAGKEVEKAVHGNKPSHDTPNYGSVNYEEFYNSIKDYITASSSKFNRILKDNKFDRFAGRFRTGELNKRRLFKYRTRDFKLFQRKTERKNKDYAFSVMMDLSGSMQGKREAESFKGVALISEVMHRCGVPYELAFFSSGHRFGKKFDEQLSRIQVGKKAGEVHGGGTDISKPFKELVGNMALRKETKRIVIVLTDGEVGDTEERYVAGIIKKNPDIQYYGIGIDVKLDTMFGRNAIEVTNVSEIVPKFAAIIKSHIKIG